MIGMDSYLNAYVDRRMHAIVEEWDLATGPDLDDFRDRLDALEREASRLKVFEQTSAEKLTALEARARSLKGRI